MNDSTESISSSSPLRDIGLESPVVGSDLEMTFYLTEMVIECILDNDGELSPTTINLEILGPGSETAAAKIFEKTSTGKWRHAGVMELRFTNFNFDDVKLIARWDQTENFGRVQLKESDIGEFFTSAYSNSEIEREFVIEKDGPPLRLKFKIIIIGAEEGMLEDDDEDSLPTSNAFAEGAARESIFATVRALADDIPNKAELLGNCGEFFMASFRDTGSEADINNCVLAYDLAIQLMPIDDPNFLDLVYNCGISFLERYKLMGNPDDIDQSVSKFKTAVTGGSDSHECMPSQLNNLGISLMHRFEQIGDQTDIDDAISYLQKAVQCTPEEHVELPAYLNGLGNSLMCRSERTGALADISEAMSVQRKAVLLTAESDADMPAQLNDLGLSLMRRFERTGDISDISEAISIQQKGVRLTPESHPEMPLQLSNLGISLMRRFERTNDSTNLSEAILFHQKAVQLTARGNANMLNNLGNGLGRRFEHMGDPTDITEAILAQQQAIHLTPSRHPNMSAQLNNLGISFMHRFERTGDVNDISEAISSQQKAVFLTPDGHADMPNMLSSLGHSFMRRFERTGYLADISDAISSHQKAVYLTPENHPDMPIWLNSLGGSLIHRSQHTNELVDTTEAILSQQRAIHITPESHPNIPSLLSSLGNSFLRRYEHTSDVRDITEAISSHQKAVHLTPEGDANMHAHLSSLAAALCRSFDRTENLADLSAAISSQQNALNIIPEHHPSTIQWLSNLGNFLTRRFELSKDLNEISEAISSHQKAVSLTPPGHADMPSRLNNLGISFTRRFEEVGDLTDIHAAISNHRLGATYSSGSPSSRFHAAKKWIHLSRKYDTSQLLDAYKTTIPLVSQVAGLENTIQKRHTNLLDISTLTVSAAATAFHFGDQKLALAWLEQGRCLVWGQLNNLRTPINALQIRNPTIAEDILRVSRALENAGSRTGSSVLAVDASMIQKISLQDDVTIHVKLAQEWDQLLAQVRAIPEFEDFLQPLSYSTLLKHLPDSGTVVVINVQQDRCDAIALRSGVDDMDPLHIRLPEFSHVKAQDLRHRLKAVLHLSMRGAKLDEVQVRGMRYEISSSDKIKDVLCDLWIFVVKPILDGLGYSEPPSELSRIWWCATGPLAFLPIHAAGIYDGSTTGTTLSDFAISSYTPTVTTLVERVKNPRSIDGSQTGLFMISQPDTPKMTPIPGTTEEVRLIRELLNKRDLKLLCLERDAATVDQGIKNMGSYSCIHFACHATQNTEEPMKSCFALHDGRLELSTIIQQHLSGADFAFLSACQTSTGDEKLSEEAVHLAAGMLAAGYRGVVATMWSIEDHYGPKIAEDFYENLIRDTAEGLNGDNAARALHYATQKLRKTLGDSESSLLIWVPYVHFGL